MMWECICICTLEESFITDYNRSFYYIFLCENNRDSVRLIFLELEFIVKCSRYAINVHELCRNCLFAEDYCNVIIMK